MTVLGRILFGSAFAVPGLLILGVGLRVVDVDPASVHAPHWLIAVLGGMFVVVGVWLYSRGTRVEPLLEAVVGPAALGGLLTALHWVAFGPGVRSCSGGITLPFVSAWRAVGGLECRMAFGFGALLFDGVLLSAGLSQLADHWLEGPSAKVADVLSKGVLLVAVAPLLPLLLVAFAFKAGAAAIAARIGLRRPPGSG